MCFVVCSWWVFTLTCISNVLDYVTERRKSENVSYNYDDRTGGHLTRFLDETVTSGIVQPGVVVGAPDASVQVQGLSGQFLGGQLAHVRSETRGFRLGVALLLPGLKVASLVDVLRVLDPLNDLRHGDEVHVVVLLDDLVDPVKEGVEELGVVLQPGGVEEQAERGAVLIVMTVEVVSEEVVELISAENV